MKALYEDNQGIGIYEVRKLEGTELEGLADWYKPMAYVGERILNLNELTWQDTPKKKTDGALPGCDNHFWLITEVEATEYSTLNQSRLDTLTAKKQAKSQSTAANREQIIDKAKATGEKQLLKSYVSDYCLDNLSDCSFDNVSIWAMPDGTEKQTHNHCF